jgi:hypothetical protein
MKLVDVPLPLVEGLHKKISKKKKAKYTPSRNHMMPIHLPFGANGFIVVHKW